MLLEVDFDYDLQQPFSKTTSKYPPSIRVEKVFFFKLLSHLKYFNIELVDLLMTNGRHHLLRWPRERVVFIQLRMGYVSVNSWGGGRAYLREIIPTLELLQHSVEIQEFSATQFFREIN